MYLPSDQACNESPNSTTPESAADIAADAAFATYWDQTFMAANGTWLGLLSRPWQSLVGLGPVVAAQARNSQPDINAESLIMGTVVVAPSGDNPTVTPIQVTSPSNPPPAGVNLVVQGNTTGANPAAGGGGARRRGHPPGKSPTAPALFDSAEFINTFGVSPEPLKLFTGKLPPQGSVMSLVLGGANRPLAIGPGRYPAPAPMPQFDSSSLTCPNPAGVNMLPWGEPDYSGAAAAAAGGSASGLGVGGVLLLLVGLAGLAYFSDDQDKKRGRVAA